MTPERNVKNLRRSFNLEELGGGKPDSTTYIRNIVIPRNYNYANTKAEEGVHGWTVMLCTYPKQAQNCSELPVKAKRAYTCP